MELYMQPPLLGAAACSALRNSMAASCAVKYARGWLHALQELGAMGKKLRLSKSHAESLSRALNDHSRHALGGGGHRPAGAAV